MKMKERILVLYVVYDSWDRPVGHRVWIMTLIMVN